MTLFDRISEEANKEADAVIKAVNGTGPRPEVEVMPGFEAMVAGAAIALERGQPHAFFRGRESRAEDHLKQYSHENRSFHNAVARVIHMRSAPGSTLDASPEGVMTHIVTDVVHQGSTKNIEMAVKDHHPAFETGFDEHEMRRLGRARAYSMHAKDVRYESYGNYSELSTAGKHNLVDVFADAQSVNEATKAHIADIAGIIRDSQAEERANHKAIDSRLADFHDTRRPLFPDVSPGGSGRREWSDARDRVEALVAGDVPRNAAEAGVAAHVAAMGAREDDHVTTESRMHALVNHEPGLSSARTALTIEAEVLAVRDARQRAWEEIDDFSPNPDYEVRRDAVAYRSYDRMAPEDQVGLFSTIRHADSVPGLASLRIVEAARLVEQDAGMRREAGMVGRDAEGAGRPIEGAPRSAAIASQAGMGR